MKRVRSTSMNKEHSCMPGCCQVCKPPQKDIGKLEVLFSREETADILLYLEELTWRRERAGSMLLSEPLVVLMRRVDEAMTLTDPCRACNGTGKVLGDDDGALCYDPCSSCRGDGKRWR